MKRNKLKLLFLLLVANPAFGQGLVNTGKLNVSGGNLVITGNLLNQVAASVITLDGTISLTGDWTDNGSGNIIASPYTNGEVIFSGNGTQTIGGSAALFEFEKLTINSGSSTQVTAGKGLTAYGACTFTAPLILKTTTTPFRPIMATFINNSTVSGNISMEMSYNSNGSSAAGGRALFFSPPINNASSTTVNPNGSTNRFFYQDEINRKNIEIKTTGVLLTVAKGYFYRSTSDAVFTFTGPPNADVSYTKSNIPMADTGHYYLMGNPYPAVIDWQTIATKTNLKNTIWYRTCTISGSMRVDTWNGTSQTGTSNNGIAVDGKIPPMQAFWIQVDVPGNIGTITIEDNDRSHIWGNAQFLKSGEILDNDIFRLFLYNNDKRDEMIIVQADEADDLFDEWDSRKMFLGDTSVAELYSLSPEGKRLVIQSVKPVTKEKLFPVAFKSTKARTLKFVADLSQTTSGFTYILEDKLLNSNQDLNRNPEYTFQSDSVNDTMGSRFVLHFAPKSSTSIVPNPRSGSDESQLIIYAFDNQLYIKHCRPDADIAIFDMLGRQIYAGKSRSDNEIIPCNFPVGCYIVKVTETGASKVQRVIIK